MARFLCHPLSRRKTWSMLNPRSSSLLLTLRAQSNRPDLTDLNDLAGGGSSSAADPLLRTLEEAIHLIIVRRSAPDWLPFLPGSSYWVPPPRSRSYGIAHLVQKLANPLTQEQSLSVANDRGWPSSDYFIKGNPPHPVDVDATSNTVPKPEDEEG